MFTNKSNIPRIWFGMWIYDTNGIGSQAERIGNAYRQFLFRYYWKSGERLRQGIVPRFSGHTNISVSNWTRFISLSIHILSYIKSLSNRWHIHLFLASVHTSSGSGGPAASSSPRPPKCLGDARCGSGKAAMSLIMLLCFCWELLVVKRSQREPAH